MYNLENKICQNCKQGFQIEPDDFKFYDKIKVPAPTFCPECRFQRRLSFDNERNLHKRRCDMCGADLITIYDKNALFPVYCQKCWNSDGWDPMKYGKDYDFNKPFFEQWAELRNIVPRPSSLNIQAVNCDYCVKIAYSKNSYYTIGFETENCLYGHYGNKLKDCADYFWLTQCDSCYNSIYCVKCSNVNFSQYAFECRDSSFLFDCRNCSHCFGCVNLRNKEYYIFNKPYPKEQYEEIIKEYDIGSNSKINELREKFNQIKINFPKRHAMLFNSVNSSGDMIRDAKNCRSCFSVDALHMKSLEDSKYIFIATGLKDCYDMSASGEGAELCYEGMLSWGYKILFSANFHGEGHDVFYSDMSKNSSNLFGCVGLKNKKFCVLNKQYTKDEYYELVSEITEHMNSMPYTDGKGVVYKFGEFFPAELSPFPFNESVAQEYFPLTKQQAIQQGYRWKEPEQRNFQFSIFNSQLPDHIKDVKDDIIGQMIQCAHYDIDKKQTICNEQCVTAFKIIPKELEFYKKHNIPLPRLCPNCRHYQRIKQRNPLKLWKRKCQCAGTRSENEVYQNTVEHSHHGTDHCPNEFQTTYSPERKEIVYCEKCYQNEVV